MTIMRDSVRRWRHEPFLHFMLAGAAIFAFYTWRGADVDVESRQIIVREAQVQRLATIWTQTWQRAPTAQELDGLIRDYIKEEIYYREANRLGLGEDDAIVRRRLRAKMEFLAASQAETMIPDEAVLQAWLAKNPARYASDPLISFRSVYLSGSKGDAKAKAVLAQLQAEADPQKLGDPISLPKSLIDAHSEDIDLQFGEGFAASLRMLPKGIWSGPILSGFGLHLVRIDRISAAHTPELGEVRQRVENDWRAATRIARENQAYQLLLDGYDIQIERP